MLGIDRVEADHLARQIETQHLLAAFLVDHARLHRARTHREDRPERIAGTEDVLADAERPDVFDQALLLGQLGLVVAGGDARAGKRAGTAEARFIAVVGNRATRLGQATWPA
jgi:hypothetical protein